ncbi:pyridoxamine 5'-phosphate oxidase family protein [Amycolatopsis sp. NPDC051071]|uniref:pyridoxamine 5'-phosphate oxidase family protein n=1 Tax=Amycolatopsis sp. NPDC051071 TaxID=3154637 RepID=UPI00342D4F10
MKRDQSLIERLARERNVWLCTLRADGSPHVTPVWFVYLDDGDAPVVAEGLVRVHREALREDVLAALAVKYDGWAAGEEIEPFGDRVLLEIPIMRWLLPGVAR